MNRYIYILIILLLLCFISNMYIENFSIGGQAPINISDSLTLSYIDDCNPTPSPPAPPPAPSDKYTCSNGTCNLHPNGNQTHAECQSTCRAPPPPHKCGSRKGCNGAKDASNCKNSYEIVNDEPMACNWWQQPGSNGYCIIGVDSCKVPSPAPAPKCISIGDCNNNNPINSQKKCCNGKTCNCVSNGGFYNCKCK